MRNVKPVQNIGVDGGIYGLDFQNVLKWKGCARVHQEGSA